MAKAKGLALRSEVNVGDTWDLSSLFRNAKQWEESFSAFEQDMPKIGQYEGKLGQDAKTLAEAIKLDLDLQFRLEKLIAYAQLRASEDEGNSESQAQVARVMSIASRYEQACSYFRPEILALEPKKFDTLLRDKQLAAFRLYLERVARYRPHSLPASEEKLLALQSEMAQASDNIFSMLNDVDMTFGTIKTKKGVLPLSHGSWVRMMQDPDRAIRAKAYKQYYQEFYEHRHTLSACLTSSVQRDVYYARARKFPSALEQSLFSDNVPRAVYTNLINTVHDFLPVLHEYYDVARRILKLKTIRPCDVYVPLIQSVRKKHTWDQAVEVVIESLKPLGKEYQSILSKGLRGRWCDRYENKGKRSGAFSYGSYKSDPYILMNYDGSVLEHVYTLAHEAGHSMHSYFSGEHQPYQYAGYSIFVAEVASTFNEQLLNQHFIERTRSKQERAYFLCRELDEVRRTLVRQTMFAEFEMIIHDIVEQHDALTLERFLAEYRKLLELYFGPKFELDDQLSLECFRIPHFYRAFYVYKYATGISAAIALSQRVLTGGKSELDDYFKLLKGGCSKWPLDILHDAGVDMASSKPIESALKRFEHCLHELKALML